MIAKLERKINTALQNKDQTQTLPYTTGAAIDNDSTTTEPLP